MSTNSPIEVLYRDFCEEDVVPKKRKANWEEGDCSVCGKKKETLPAGSLLGQTFGSWTEVAQFNVVSRLCKSCAWAFKDKRLLRNPFWITSDQATMMTWAEFGVRLSQGNISIEESAIAPVGGRKIVAPYACWGALTADHGTIKWESKYRKALLACYQLHKVGARGQLLLEPVIPFKILSQCPPNQHKALQDMWQYLSYIREDKTLISLFVKISMNIGK